MPPAPSGLALLLMAGLAFAATPPPPLPGDAFLTTAVCDKRPPCPPPCPAANSTTQCLYYLTESHKEEACGPTEWGPERRRSALQRLRMRHCCEHAVADALPEAAFHGGAACRRHLDALLATDQLAARVSCSHSEVLKRYDCKQTFSIAHRCHHCKEAYRRWVCSSLVPQFTRAGERMLPCLSVCQDVEQQCPYLLPGDWTNVTVPPGETAHPTPQYAGEPTFLCLDPNIPETGEQRARSSRGHEDCCYTHCGSPGRGREGGGGGIAEALGVCEHCPGRPANATQNASEMATTSSSASAASRTYCIKVLSLLWTAWIIYKTIIEERSTHLCVVLNSTIKCLLVLCAYSVRTTQLIHQQLNKTWTKTKCGTCS